MTTDQDFIDDGWTDNRVAKPRLGAVVLAYLPPPRGPMQCVVLYGRNNQPEFHVSGGGILDAVRWWRAAS